MTAFIHSAFLEALGWAVLNSMWQMAFLWIIYNTALSIPKSVRPSHKSAIAVTLLLCGFAWFVFTFISLFASKDNNSSIVRLNGLPENVNQNLNSFLDTILPYASVLYMTLFIIPASRFVRNYRYVQMLRRNNLSKIDVSWRMFVRKVGAQIGITKPVHIWVSSMVTSPVTIGYLKPIILVPLAAMNNLTTQQMEAVLLHELTHIKRYDYLVNLIINFIQSVLYFNPFVKAFIQTIERERERSCDELVIQFQYDPHNYASALLTLEKNNVVAQNMAIAAAGKNDLFNRVERILNIDSKPVFTFNKLAGLFAGLLCIIILNAVIIVDKPETRKGSFAFETLTSPVFMFSDDNAADKPATGQPVNNDNKKETTPSSIVNHAATAKINPKNKPAPVNDEADAEETDGTDETATPYFAANTDIPATEPELNTQEIKHVEQAVEATKKVIEDAQWKEVEASIADAMTEAEKEVVKEKYNKELEKVNWQKLEDKIKASYDKLNWNKINEQLGAAVVNIKLDSLVKVYTIVKENLDKAEEMANSADNVTSEAMPLPDVSVEKIKENKCQVQKKLTTLKAIRSKKIVHL